MANRIVVKNRIYLCCSSSVSNFEEKITKNWELNRRKHHLFSPTLFFGLYHILDYLKYIFHFGKRYIFWCGSDILNLTPLWAFIIKCFRAKHYCENWLEKDYLMKYKINARVTPVFLDNIRSFPICYKPAIIPNVYLCAHPGREQEYGVDTVKVLAQELPDIHFHVYGISGLNTQNLSFHGNVSNERFNKDIREYQCGLRLNGFDGFSELTAKSILMGQYPITRIEYPFIDQMYNIDDLIGLLRRLKHYKKPNIKARKYWLKNINKLEFL